MNCVVTGGAGFIGSHLVDALLAEGNRVDVIDDLSSGRRANLDGAIEAGAVLHSLDVRDAHRLRELLMAIRPAIVFHLAAQIDVRSSVQDPAADATANVLGTIAVLEAARACGAGRVVNSSTGGGLYGNASVLPTPEDHPIRPLAPYGQAKYSAEGYCELYTRLHGLSTISLRYGNVYGPRQNIHGEAGVVAIFCGHLVSGTRPIVFGTGRQTRDWVEVSDIVQANQLAAAGNLTGPVNIGHGRETSVLELIESLAVVGRETSGAHLTEPLFADERPGEVARSCLAVSRARRELGWEASVDLRSGLRRLLETL